MKMKRKKQACQPQRLISWGVALILLVGVSWSLPAADWTVARTNFSFVPLNLTVSAGDTVTWVNQDFTGHDTISGTNRIPTGLWGSPLLGHGGTFSFTFNIPAG